MHHFELHNCEHITDRTDLQKKFNNKCESCDKRYDTRKNLIRHSKKTHTFQCNKCHKKYIEKAQLRRHESLHLQTGQINSDIMQDCLMQSLADPSVSYKSPQICQNFFMKIDHALFKIHHLTEHCLDFP